MARELQTLDPHKLENQVRQFGFEEEEDFASTLRDFVKAHNYAFAAFAQAHVLLRGGNRFMDNPPKLCQFALKCCSAPGSTRDLATTFKVTGYRFITVDRFTDTQVAADSWDRSAPLRRDAEQFFSRSSLRFEGLLPVAYHVDGIPTCQIHFYPKKHPSLLFYGMPEETKRRLLLEAATFCLATINAGLALGEFSRQNSVLVPRRIVRSGGVWKFEPIFANWEEYMEGPRQLEELNTILERLGYAEDSSMLVTVVRILL